MRWRITGEVFRQTSGEDSPPLAKRFAGGSPPLCHEWRNGSPVLRQGFATRGEIVRQSSSVVRQGSRGCSPMPENITALLIEARRRLGVSQGGLGDMLG
jgi:hypothetical protein